MSDIEFDSAIATASFRVLSPNTIMYIWSFTCNELNIDIVATGSIADIKHPKCKELKKGNLNGVSIDP